MYEVRLNKKYSVCLKLDCRKMSKKDITELAEKLMHHMAIQIIGGNVIYAKGRVTNFEYGKIWDITDNYDVIID